MKFENTGIEQLKADINRIDEAMRKQGLIRGGHWDYERVTFDKKFEIKEGVYYLRVRGYSVEGNVDSNRSTIQLMTPLLGKYYYPHGVEYGEDEHFPSSLVTQCQNIINTLKTDIEKFAMQ